MEKAALLFLMLMMPLMKEVCSQSVNREPTSTFWHKTLPFLSVPPEIQARFSPLQTKETALFLGYIKRGSLPSHSVEFCKAAGLVCKSRKGEVIARNHGTFYSQHLRWSNVNGAIKNVPNTYFNSDYKSSEFFRVKKLVKGGKMKIAGITNHVWKRPFLPRDLSSQLPFSTKQLPELLTLLKIDSTSSMAQMMASTLDECEALRKNEKKKCATSVEDMVDYATQLLGPQLSIVETTGPAKLAEGKTVTLVDVSLRSSEEDEAMGCHDIPFPYSVYYCHSIPKTKSYQVTWKGANNELVRAAAVCHMDTTDFDPAHPSFALLNTKPGEGEICHWLYNGNFIWVPSK
eukprot:Gb_24161 [translate_table: standard]